MSGGLGVQGVAGTGERMWWRWRLVHIKGELSFARGGCVLVSLVEFRSCALGCLVSLIFLLVTSSSIPEWLIHITFIIVRENSCIFLKRLFRYPSNPTTSHPLLNSYSCTQQWTAWQALVQDSCRSHKQQPHSHTTPCGPCISPPLIFTLDEQSDH